jgi:hypothetical protein
MKVATLRFDKRGLTHSSSAGGLTLSLDLTLVRPPIKSTLNRNHDSHSRHRLQRLIPTNSPAFFSAPVFCGLRPFAASWSPSRRGVIAEVLCLLSARNCESVRPASAPSVLPSCRSPMNFASGMIPAPTRHRDVCKLRRDGNCSPTLSAFARLILVQPYRRYWHFFPTAQLCPYFCRNRSEYERATIGGAIVAPFAREIANPVSPI